MRTLPGLETKPDVNEPNASAADPISADRTGTREHELRIDLRRKGQEAHVRIPLLAAKDRNTPKVTSPKRVPDTRSLTRDYGSSTRKRSDSSAEHRASVRRTQQ